MPQPAQNQDFPGTASHSGPTADNSSNHATDEVNSGVTVHMRYTISIDFHMPLSPSESAPSTPSSTTPTQLGQDFDHDSFLNLYAEGNGQATTHQENRDDDSHQHDIPDADPHGLLDTLEESMRTFTHYQPRETLEQGVSAQSHVHLARPGPQGQHARRRSASLVPWRTANVEPRPQGEPTHGRRPRANTSALLWRMASMPVWNHSPEVQHHDFRSRQLAFADAGPEHGTESNAGPSADSSSQPRSHHRGGSSSPCYPDGAYGPRQRSTDPVPISTGRAPQSQQQAIVGSPPSQVESPISYSSRMGYPNIQAPLRYDSC